MLDPYWIVYLKNGSSIKNKLCKDIKLSKKLGNDIIILLSETGCPLYFIPKEEIIYISNSCVESIEVGIEKNKYKDLIVQDGDLL